MYASTFLIAGLGVTVLSGLTFAATPQSDQVALLFPPWQDDGFARAAATGLPVVELRWRGHLIILDTRGDPLAVARLQGQGFWPLDADATGLCTLNSREV